MLKLFDFKNSLLKKIISYLIYAVYKTLDKYYKNHSKNEEKQRGNNGSS